MNTTRSGFAVGFLYALFVALRRCFLRLTDVKFSFGIGFATERDVCAAVDPTTVAV